MKGLRTLYKDSKKNSLYGMKAKRQFHILLMAFALFIGMGALCYAADTVIGKTTGIVMMATAPAAVLKKSNKEIIADKKAKLQKNFANVMKSLDENGQAMLEAIIAEIDELYTLVNDEGLPDIIEALQTKLTELEGKLPKDEEAAAAEEELKKLKQAVADLKLGKFGNAQKSFKEQFKDFLGSAEFKDAVKSKKEQVFTIKAVATITTANASASAPHALSFEIVPGIQEKPFEDNVVLAALSKGGTSSATIIWINRKDKDGGAAFISEGGLKPLKDWTYEEENSKAKKVAVSTKVSTEMLNDFEFMESEIRMLLERDLLKVVDEKLLSGAGGVEPDGILSGAAAYVGTGLDETITRPTNADAIRAGMLQMRLLNYKPDVVFMNPTDTAALDLLKTADGHYIKVEIDAIMQHIKVIETTEVTAGSFLLMDTQKWTVKILEDLEVKFGWENDDFRKNLVTVIAEMRLHSYQYSVDAGAVLYDEFATVKTALAVPEPEPPASGSSSS
ncbi:MAG: phage major capsid protein [Prevotellaceae bacterium]|jgi:HK97 family phage major capsid protein|nr:phage major capsid protein [Prevotellaceae bacterium]